MVEEFGSKQPMAVRNQVYGAMYEEILNAVNKGQPAAGGLGACLMMPRMHTSRACNLQATAASIWQVLMPAAGEKRLRPRATPTTLL